MRVLTYSTTITLTQHTYMLGSGTAGAFLFLPTPPHLWHRARIFGIVPAILASCPVCLPSFRKRHPQVGDHPPAKAHKNLDFVLETPENEGSEGQKSTKTSILCSKRPKTGVPKAKKAQKWSFCAREEGDWHREERKLASGSITAETLIVNVAFLQITAHALKT